MTRHCFAALASIALLGGAVACSSPSDGPAPGTPQQDQVCKFAGEQACGVDASGKQEALLICEVTPDKGRVWVLQEVCTLECVELECFQIPAEVVGEVSAEVVPVEDLVELPPPCVPDCEGKDCGDDGCGGQCALCPPDHACGEDFKCHLHCAPVCAGKQCGDDGCGGSCGGCPFNMACTDGLCQCKPQCTGKDCGPDGCGGTCGECALGYQCSPFGQCQGVCQPACAGKLCGPDGCGGTCGACPPGLFCSPTGECTNQCYPSCEGKECGSDGCFGVCGFCPCPTCAPDKTDCSSEGKCIVKSTKLGCSGLLDCLANCPEGDAGCQDDCFGATSPKAQQMYQDLIDCIVAECTMFPTDQCIQDSLMGICFTVYMDCVNDL
jgi:hypothetical protein